MIRKYDVKIIWIYFISSANCSSRRDTKISAEPQSPTVLFCQGDKGTLVIYSSGIRVDKYANFIAWRESFRRINICFTFLWFPNEKSFNYAIESDIGFVEFIFQHYEAIKRHVVIAALSFRMLVWHVFFIINLLKRFGLLVNATRFLIKRREKLISCHFFISLNAMLCYDFSSMILRSEVHLEELTRVIDKR